MASPRTPGEGENVRSHSQGGEAVQEVGPMLWSGTEWVRADSAAATPDNASGANIGETAIGLYNSNGNFDQMRSNLNEEIALASEAHTETVTSALIVNFNHTKLIVRLAVTTAGTGTLRVNISAEAGIIASFAPFKPTAPSSTYFLMAPGLDSAPAGGIPAEGAAPTVRSAAVKAFVPRRFEITVVPSDSSSWTYSVLYGLTL
jgi:hypothetical protein